MPLDPNIILAGLRNQDGNEILQGMQMGQSMAARQQQMQMQRMQMEEAQRQQESQQAVDSALAHYAGKGGQIDREGVARYLGLRGEGRALQGLQQGWGKSDAEIAKAQREAGKARIEEMKARGEFLSSNMGAARIAFKQGNTQAAQATWSRARAQAAAMGEDVSMIPERYDDMLAENLFNAGIQSKDQATLLQKQFEFEEGRKAEAAKPLSPIAQINADVKRGLMSPEQGQAAIKKATHLAPEGGGMANITIGQVGDTLKDPAEERIAQMIAAGKLAAPPMSRNNPRNLRIIARADAISQQGTGEGLDAAKYGTRAGALKYWTTGQGAAAERQQETILHHAKVLKQAMTAMNNGDMQLANKFANEAGIQFGNDAATNYKIASAMVSSEVGKYLAGGTSTQAERQEMEHLLPAFSSPQQFVGGLDTLSKLVEGQRQSWQVQKKAALEGKAPTYGGESKPTFTLEQVKALSKKNGQSVTEIIKSVEAKGGTVR